MRGRRRRRDGMGADGMARAPGVIMAIWVVLGRLGGQDLSVRAAAVEHFWGCFRCGV